MGLLCSSYSKTSSGVLARKATRADGKKYRQFPPYLSIFCVFLFTSEISHATKREHPLTN